MWKKNQGWSDKYLSKEVREVSVRSVAQEIPTDCMSSILLPESLGEELERIVKKKIINLGGTNDHFTNFPGGIQT